MSDDKSQIAKNSWVRPTVMILLGMLIIANFMGGGVIFGYGMLIWVENGFDFNNLGFFAWIFGMAGAGILLFSMLLLGVLLRVSRWPRAPLGGLVLSIFSTLFIFSCYWFFLQGLESFGNEVLIRIFQGLALFMLLVVSLPPFLHWRRARSGVP